MDWSNLYLGIGTPVVRSVLGWIENSLQDGEISKFEIAELGATVTRVGLMAISSYWVLDGFGVDGAKLGAAGSAIVLDFLLRALKVSKKK